MVKEFNNLEEIEKYYDKNINTYLFKEDEVFIDTVVFNFDLNVKANIMASNIKAFDINAYDIDADDIIASDIKAADIKVKDIDACNINVSDIDANDIKAYDINADNIYANDIDAYDINSNNINAKDINYWAVCFAYNDIKCKSITGSRENSKHFVLDGKLEVTEND